MPNHRFPHVKAARVTALAALVTACASAPPSIPQIDLGAQDFAFVLPDTIAGGLVRFRFVNDGQENHHAQFLRLNDGVTRAQFDSAFGAVMAAAQTEGDAAFMRILEVATAAGGPGVTAPGGRSGYTTTLASGEYLLLCFIASPDGIPHLAKGMRHWLTVTAPAAETPEAPVATARVDMTDFAYGEVPPLDSGRVVLEVTNSGQEPHEMVVMRLEAPLGQVMAMLAGPPPAEGAEPPGPPPFEFVGGAQAIMPGDSGWVTLDLPPGDYAMICFIPSPANEGRPHIELGMVRPFTIG